MDNRVTHVIPDGPNDPHWCGSGDGYASSAHWQVTCPDCLRRRKRFKVRFPNGLVIYSTWYKHPWMSASGKPKKEVCPWPDPALITNLDMRSRAGRFHWNRTNTVAQDKAIVERFLYEELMAEKRKRESDPLAELLAA